MVSRSMSTSLLYLAAVCVALGSLLPCAQGAADTYLIGTGSHDVTGAMIGLGFMGYAQPSQVGTGLHFRQRARAFIVASPSDPKQRVCYVSTDNAFVTEAIHLKVIQELETRFNGVYTAKNTMLSGTHTHSTPGGHSWYTLYDVTTYGVDQQTIQAFVNGIVEAISKAHANLKPGSLTHNKGKLADANINRSAPAYLLNPLAERQQYPDGNTDKDFTTVKFTQSQQGDVGLIAIFSVHGTSMNLTNTLVSGDNKGLASYLFEKYMNGNSTLPGNGTFVAAFGQTNEGDVSPNTGGAKCPDGSPCAEDSTCNGREETCVGRGPGKDMFDSTWIIGNKQYNTAMELFRAPGTPLTGPVDFRFSYVDFSSLTIDPEFWNNATIDPTCKPPPGPRTTCKPAMGMSFAAGTTDGRGDFNFKQGTTVDNAPWFWKEVSKLLRDPTPEQAACHCPKPILVDTGEIDKPWPWAPTQMPVQLFRVGQLWILGAPGEFTTMSGRRLRAAVQKAVTAAGQWTSTSDVIIAGLTNTYAGYIATLEEYQMQRYEAASTQFGPNTLQGYIQEFSRLATAICTGAAVPFGTPPADRSDHFPGLPSALTNLIRGKRSYDTAPEGQAFGTCIKQPAVSAQGEVAAGTVVQAEFVAGDLRRNLMTQDSFSFIDVKLGNGTWIPHLSDSDWDTKLHWRREKFTEAVVTVEWEINPSISGTFRIRHQGYYLGRKDSTPQFYSGTSQEFQVVSQLTNESVFAQIGVSAAHPTSKTGQAFWIGIVLGAGLCVITWQVIVNSYKMYQRRRGVSSSELYDVDEGFSLTARS